MVWAEAVGDRASVRFFAADDEGRPLSPNAEIVDLAARPTGLSILPAGDGFVIGWSEAAGDGTRSFLRKTDARGRARDDVMVAQPVPPLTPVATACSDSPAGLRCATRRGPLELPRGAQVAAEHISDEDGAAVIASGADGLALYLLACAPPEPVVPAAAAPPAVSAAP